MIAQNQPIKQVTATGMSHDFVTPLIKRSNQPLTALQWYVLVGFLITLAVGFFSPLELQAQATTGCVYTLLSLLVYFMPAFVAQARRHHHAPAIFMLDLFFGWTVLGWVIALAGAFTRPEGKGQMSGTARSEQ